MAGNALVKWAPPSAERLFKLLGSAPSISKKAPWWKRLLEKEYEHPHLMAAGLGALLGGTTAGLASIKRKPKETKAKQMVRGARSVLGGLTAGGILGFGAKSFANLARANRGLWNDAPLTHTTPIGPGAWKKMREVGEAHFKGPAGSETIVGVGRPFFKYIQPSVREVPKRKAWERLINPRNLFANLDQKPTDAAGNQLFSEIVADLQAGARAVGRAAPAQNPAEHLVQRLRGLGYDTNKLMQTLHPDRFAAAGLKADEAELLRKGFMHARAGGKGPAKEGPFFGLGKELKELQDRLERQQKRLF